MSFFETKFGHHSNDIITKFVSRQTIEVSEENTDILFLLQSNKNQSKSDQFTGMMPEKKTITCLMF
jgi:hypothetical protein